MKRSAVGAIAGQGVQALASFILQVLVARTLGLEGLGAFAIVYGLIVLCSAVVTGFVGDSLVVLDRSRRSVRSALQGYGLLLPLVTAAPAFAVTTAVGVTTPLEATAATAAAVAFSLEELIRRSLMASLRFWRVPVTDAIGFAVALGVVGAFAAVGRVDLTAYLIALCGGQLVALVIGVRLLPREERWLAPPVPGGWREVARYGIWRSLQQLLRPALLTGVRAAVTVVAGLATTGLLEAARTYTAPALLAINGMSSFLFVVFARSADQRMRARLRHADRAVLVMLGVVLVVSVLAIALLPVLGAVLFGTTPDLVAVVGWLVYIVSVAAVTPYGALAATAGRQAAVFGIRIADTTLSLAGAITALLFGASPEIAPLILAAGSALGGVAIRVMILRPGAGREL